MKIACLTVLLASAMSASASPFHLSFQADGPADGPGTPASTAPVHCSLEMSAVVECAQKNKYGEAAEKCHGDCTGLIPEGTGCTAGCDAIGECNAKCTPLCDAEIKGWVNCLMRVHPGPDGGVCVCPTLEAESRGIRGFVPKPALDIEDERAQEGVSVEEETPRTSISADDACVAPARDSANSSNDACDDFCSSHSFDSHAYADLVGSDTSTSSSEECLCFDLSDYTSLSLDSLTKTSGDLGIEVCSSSDESKKAKKRRDAKRSFAKKEAAVKQE